MKISKPASRIFALLLAVFMVFGMLPVSAFAAEGDAVVYEFSKTTAAQIAAGDEIIIVGYDGAKYHAVENDNNDYQADVNVTDGKLTIPEGTDVTKIIWTVNEATGAAKEDNKGNTHKFTFSNNNVRFRRDANSTHPELLTTQVTNEEKRYGHTTPGTYWDKDDTNVDTFGNYSSNHDFYGLFYYAGNDEQNIAPCFAYEDMTIRDNRDSKQTYEGNITFFKVAKHNVKAVAGQTATCETPGWKDYYECTDNDCDAIFADTVGTRITDLAAWKSGEGKIAAGHKYGDLIAKVEAQHTSTALVDGKEAHYECSVCHNLFVDEGETKKEVTEAQLKIEAAHEFGTAWDHKVAEGHAHKCSCGANDTIVAHTPGAAATETTDQTCTACGFVIKAATGHVTHSNGVKQNGQAATCTEAGWKDYYKCGGCDKLFKEEACTNEITLEAWKSGEGKIPAGHNYGTLIAQVDAVHTQTELKAGTKAHYKCSVCDKLFVDEGETKKEVTEAQLVIAAPEHTPGAYINTDANKHWKECSVCSLKSAEANHDFTDGDCVCGAKAPVQVTYEKIDAEDIKVGMELLIVGKDGTEFFALTNDDDQTTAVTVSGDKVTVAQATANKITWTVGGVNDTQKDGDHNHTFTFSNNNEFIRRAAGDPKPEAVMIIDKATADEQKRCGHVALVDTIGNYTSHDAYYGLYYEESGDRFVYNDMGGQDGSEIKNDNKNITFYAKPVAVTGVTLDKSTAEVEIGKTVTLTATVTPDSATDKTVTWTSADPAIATVANGVVTGVKAGTATITAQAGEQSATCTVTVKAAQTPEQPTTVSYTKINVSDIKVGMEIVIVGKDGNKNYALTNGTNKATEVAVSDNTVTVDAAAKVEWTVGTPNTTQVDGDHNHKFTFSNDGSYIHRDPTGDHPENLIFSTGTTAANQKRVGHTVNDFTIGNYSSYNDFYGLFYDGTKGFVYEDMTGNDQTYSQNITFYANADTGEDDDDDNQGGGTVTNPEGTTYVAFTSDVHSQTTSATSGSPARLNNWLENVSGKIKGTFDTMAFCGDNADGTGAANDDDYWNKVAAVMSVVSNSNKVNGDGIFINGNHEWSNGKVGSTNNATAKKIKNVGDVINADDYVIYVFGAAGSNQSYNKDHITALGNWLKTAPTNKPIFIISHFPIHSAANRTTANAETLRTTLNEYADDHEIYMLWGHNHTYANKGEDHYDKVYTGTLDNQTIGFTYLAAGCMSDTEYYDGTGANVKGKGLVAKIVDGKVETLTYYGESGNVIGDPYVVDKTPVNPDPDQPADPDQPDEPIVPDEPGKVTALEDGYYIIVSNNNTKALTNTANSGYSNSSGYSYSGFNGADVTISGDKITKGATESMVFEIKAVTGGYTIKNVEKNQYLTATYTQASSGSGYDGKLFLSNTAEVWELDSNFRLKSTNASQNGRNLGLYLTYDDKADSLSSGAANFFGIRSEGQNSDFANVDKIDFYKVEVKEEPEPEQPEQPEHKHTWGEATYTFAADGKSCTATRACTEDATHTESATATITSAVKTAATCETMGTTTYTATFTEEWAETQTKDVQDIPVIAHVFENGECTNCGIEDPAEADLFELYGANMLLGNNLAMNFYIEPDDLEFGEDYYAVITKTYADREDLEIIIEDDDWDEAYNMYRVSLDKIAAKEMADEITVVIYNDDDEQVSKTWVDSVRDYTMRVLVKEEAKTTSDKELLALYVEMLNYGAAAQDYFDYNEDDLANNELNAAQKAYGLGTVAMEDFRVEGTGYVGTSLTLESNILMNFFFNNIPTEHDDMYAIATYTDHYGEAKQIKVEGENFIKHNSTIWKVSVSGLVVADCRELVSVKVYEADGDVIASVTDSIESYTARMDGDGPLYVAIMNFAVAAYNTFH